MMMAAALWIREDGINMYTSVASFPLIVVFCVIDTAWIKRRGGYYSSGSRGKGSERKSIILTGIAFLPNVVVEDGKGEYEKGVRESINDRRSA